MGGNEEEVKKVGNERGGKGRREKMVEELSKERKEKKTRSKVVFVLRFAFFLDSP